MSTRSVIAVETETGWEGIYCHWDGYPTNRAAQIWRALDELQHDTETLRAYCLRPGESGYWSSFETPSEGAERSKLARTIVCKFCDGTGKRPLDEYWFQPDKCNGCNSTGHQENFDARGGWYREAERSTVRSDGHDAGTEWAYIITDHSLKVYCQRYHGDPDAGDWVLVGAYPWYDDEPNWEAVEKHAAAVAHS